jgi:hypothetical protein
MKRFLLLTVAAVLSVAVSAPAQITIEGRLGRHIRGTVVLAGHDDHHGHRHNRDVDHRRHREVERRERGHWKTVHEKVRVPGYWRDEHVPATYGWVIDSCGHRNWGIVDHGGCRRVWVPACWETRSRQVWVRC